MNKLKRIEDEDMEEEDEDEEEREIIMAAEEESFLLPPVSAAIVPVGQSRKGPLTTAPPNRSTVTVQPDIPSASRPSSAATQPPRYEHVTLYPHVSVKSMSRTGNKLSLGKLFFPLRVNRACSGSRTHETVIPSFVSDLTSIAKYSLFVPLMAESVTLASSSLCGMCRTEIQRHGRLRPTVRRSSTVAEATRAPASSLPATTSVLRPTECVPTTDNPTLMDVPI